ncbi:MAG TPA: 3-deoxy-7-phosphoheptulonate synthase class II [Polyangia bacterium]
MSPASAAAATARGPVASSSSAPAGDWSPTSWTKRVQAQAVAYPDQAALDAAVTRLSQLPPLVTSWEIERLRDQIAEAQMGRRFLLQGGDCAETLADCQPDVIARKLKILMQMSLVLIHGSQKPVIRMGRWAGQYAKPRSSATETRDGVTLPSYFGDLLNRQDFTPAARTPDPELLLQGYLHAAITMNFVRSLAAGGFADLHHPEFWDLSHLSRADLSPQMRDEYQGMVRQLSEALRFMEALGERAVDDLTRVEFFASHEGLSLYYEAAQTKVVPRREGHYDLSTHMPWIGERTRDVDGAHVEFFRGIRNPVGVKVGPKASPAELITLLDRLNPGNELGKIVLISRCGAGKVAEALPPLIEAVKREGRHVLWISDPMHGNGRLTSTGIKTRDFQDILREVEISFEVHERMGTHLGGVHFELTGDDVTECIGGGLNEGDLDRNYLSACDPRLNYRQALEMAFRLSKRMAVSQRAR